MIKKYKKKPVVIEALVWEGHNEVEMREFMKEGRDFYIDDEIMYIITLEGAHKADINDYIIKGIKGEFYPCKPDIFELTYEKVKDNKWH